MVGRNHIDTLFGQVLFALNLNSPHWAGPIDHTCHGVGELQGEPALLVGAEVDERGQTHHHNGECRPHHNEEQKNYRYKYSHFL